VPVQKLSIKEFLQRSGKNLLLDVRSEGEFHHAHLPSAISFPLFTNEERKVVGTAYKQKSREEAIKIGLDFFAPKMRKMVEQVETMLQSNAADGQVRREVYLYCWRGGMRSAGVAWLLDLYGFKVFTLSGGYKAFRNYILETFKHPFQIKLIGGYTGSGKTVVLHRLEKEGERVIDLEKLASHKGSAFGSLNMPPQPTQEMFENRLGLDLLNILEGGQGPAKNDLLLSQPFVWMEDESQRIGNLNIPMQLWHTMRSSPVIFLEIPFEERLGHILEEYGNLDKASLIEAVQRISKRLGGFNTKNTIEYLESGNIKDAFRILLQYYDKHYFKGLHNRDNLKALLTTIWCTRVTSENAQLLTKYQPA
jgi:tRNA 2-selenouridine synthase